MPQSDAFLPVIDSATKTMTCVQVTTAATAASTKLIGNEILVKCLTAPCYIRLSKVNGVAVTASIGYYMAIGDEVRWQTSEGADYLQYIRTGGSDGALSIAYGTGA